MRTGRETSGAVVVWEGNAKKYENEEEGGWGGFDNDGIHT